MTAQPMHLSSYQLGIIGRSWCRALSRILSFTAILDQNLHLPSTEMFVVSMCSGSAVIMAEALVQSQTA
jgi:hypothetical protein